MRSHTAPHPRRSDRESKVGFFTSEWSGWAGSGQNTCYLDGGAGGVRKAPFHSLTYQGSKIQASSRPRRPKNK